eukprot:GHVU01187554.1.p1 GENE.GHVU01187554.1~~GHVU01187554.1.p1  ORF type:complete len:226 (-),score=1.60 GHVU01187554.1:167-844(-)
MCASVFTNASIHLPLLDLLSEKHGGNTHNSQGNPCTMECNDGTLCGGSYKNTVYSTGQAPVLWHLGCWADSGSNRALLEEVTDWGSNAMDCVRRCAHLGYPVAGLQGKTQCFCGDFYDKHGKSSACNTRCPGGSLCGGANSNDVYATSYYLTMKEQIRKYGEWAFSFRNEGMWCIPLGRRVLSCPHWFIGRLLPVALLPPGVVKLLHNSVPFPTDSWVLPLFPLT